MGRRVSGTVVTVTVTVATAVGSLLVGAGPMVAATRRSRPTR
jgi:hypothetical protein